MAAEGTAERAPGMVWAEDLARGNHAVTSMTALVPHSKGATDFSEFDEWLDALHEATNPLLRFGRHLARRRLLCVDPHPENNREAFRFLDAAARVAGRPRYALTFAAELTRERVLPVPSVS